MHFLRSEDFSFIFEPFHKNLSHKATLFLLDTNMWKTLFREAAKTYCFLNGPALTPPPLSGRATKNKNFIVASLSYSYDILRNIR